MCSIRITNDHQIDWLIRHLKISKAAESSGIKEESSSNSFFIVSKIYSRSLERNYKRKYPV